MSDAFTLWQEATGDTAASYRRQILAAVEQLSDEEFFRRPAPGFNSVAIIVRHIAGNLKSRWTDFLYTDGEKPDRNRDAEFEDWPSDRASLMQYFDEGWSRLTAAIDSIDAPMLERTIAIRGEVHSLPLALSRSLAHTASHAGQIVMLARMMHQGDWRWLSIQPGMSEQYNKANWSAAATNATSTSATSGDRPSGE